MFYLAPVADAGKNLVLEKCDTLASWWYRKLVPENWPVCHHHNSAKQVCFL